MSRKPVYLLAAAVSVAVVCASLLLLNNGADSDEHVAPEVAQSDGASTTPAPVAEVPGVEKTEDGFDFDDELKSKLRAIGNAYEARAQYPEFSQPIAPDEIEAKYRGNTPVPSELPADLSDPNSPGISILTDRFRYFPGDQLVAQATISGLSEEESSTVTAHLMRGGEPLSRASITPVPNEPHSYFLDFVSLQLDDVSWKQRLTIRAEFVFRGKSYTRDATVEYVSTVASVDGVARSEVENEYLLIPVYVSTEKPGLHRLQANLYDAASGEPLVHLSAEGQVDSSGSLELKAHIASLKSAGSEGPYDLKDLVLTRLPTSPDYITEYGRVDQERYQIGKHSFEDYLDKPYVNPKANRIASELRRLGS